MLAQRTSREVEAKTKQAENEANCESRLREKEEWQRQVHERAQVREVNRDKRERREAEKRAVDGRRWCQGGASESMEATNPSQLQLTSTTASQIRLDAIVEEAANPPQLQ